jgi:hypothetical protein
MYKLYAGHRNYSLTAILHLDITLSLMFIHVLLSDSLLPSSSKIVLNASRDQVMTMVDDPIKFSEMLVTKIKELLKGSLYVFFYYISLR